jgi:hypothetical protein
VLAGLAVAAVVSSTVGAGTSVAAGSGDTPAFTDSETITRDHLVDGADAIVDTRHVSVTVSETDHLRDRQALSVTWTGAHPTGGVFADVNSGAAAQEEYPVVLLQCRGVDSDSAPDNKRLSPKTCWTSTPLERYQASDFIFPPYRVDRYAAVADRTISPGQPDPVPAACAPFVSGGASYWLPFVAADGHSYVGGGGSGCAGIPPEAVVTEGAIPSNQTYGVSDSQGNGSAKFVVQSADTNASLGCSDTVPCSLVIVPIMGISCDTAAAGLPADDQPATFGVTDTAFAQCSKTGRFAPGEVNPGTFNQEDLAVAGALWWAGSNWRNRISVPLTFAQSASVCSVLNNAAPLYVYGSETMLQATLQWAPKFCTSGGSFNLQHVQTGEPQAKNLLETGSVEAAYQAAPPTTPFTKRVAEAPVGVTGWVIATAIDDDQGHDLANVKLTPRLLAKLITESYPSNPSVRSAYKALSGNPWSMAQDPEFLALNPHALAFPPPTESASTLMMLSSSSDLVSSVTKYIEADPDARSFLSGKPDPWGMVVNPNYKNISLPAEIWPLLDTFEPKDLYQPSTNDCLAVSPVPWLPLVASPVQQMSVITLDLQYNIANSQIRCQNEAQLNQKLTALGRQTPGVRFILGLTSLADAARYQLDTAQLLTHTASGAATKFTDSSGRSFVGPSDDSLRATAALLQPDKDLGTWPIPYSTLRTSADGTDAYPGTLVMSMDVPVEGLPRTDAANYASFLRFAAGTGQELGVGNGQLPAGFLPMTADNGLDDLAGYTRRVATAVAAQTGDLPYVTGGSTGPGTGTGATTTPPPAGGSAPPPAGGPAPSTPPGTGGSTPGAQPSTSGNPVAEPVSLGTTAQISSGAGGLALPLILGAAVLCALAASLTGWWGRRGSGS